jgi:hypothetical protein
MHPGQPMGNERARYAEFGADRDHQLASLRQCDRSDGLLRQSYETRREALELLSAECQLGAGFVAHEKRLTEFLLKDSNARAHRRLRNVQAGGRVCEASGLDDFKKRSGRTDVHVLRVCSLDDRYGREARGSFEVLGNRRSSVSSFRQWEAIWTSCHQLGLQLSL